MALGAVEHVVVAGTPSAQRHRVGGITVLGLGERQGEPCLSGDDVGNPSASQLGTPVALDAETAECNGLGERRWSHRAAELLEEDGEVHEGAVAAAVLGREREAEEAELCQLRPQRGVVEVSRSAESFVR